MIHGIGVDICDSKRIRKIYQRYENRFLSRVFIDQEVEYCLKKSNPAPYLAARFAFKEAFFKALNPPANWPEDTWPTTNITFHDIGLSGQEGRKNVYTSGRLNSILQEMSVNNIQFSISHERHYSIAMVLLEKNS